MRVSNEICTKYIVVYVMEFSNFILIYPHCADENGLTKSLYIILYTYYLGSYIIDIIDVNVIYRYIIRED